MQNETSSLNQEKKHRLNLIPVMLAFFSIGLLAIGLFVIFSLLNNQNLDQQNSIVVGNTDQENSQSEDNSNGESGSDSMLSDFSTEAFALKFKYNQTYLGMPSIVSQGVNFTGPFGGKNAILISFSDSPVTIEINPAPSGYSLDPESVVKSTTNEYRIASLDGDLSDINNRNVFYVSSKKFEINNGGSSYYYTASRLGFGVSGTPPAAIFIRAIDPAQTDAEMELFENEMRSLIESMSFDISELTE